MNISQILRKPSNWQDFERLCWMLWRVEWNSDDLKLNGRSGQQQNGVDICGHRSGHEGYYGIQAKCKKEGERLTEKEINAEIEKAKCFKPTLKHLVLATTSEKDATIEEYVRVQDEELRQAGLFSLNICSWEDIVFLLDQNKSVLDLYLGITTEDFKVAVRFAGDMEVLDTEAEYLMVPDPQKYLAYLDEKRKEYAYSPFSYSKEKRLIECNYSYFEVNLLIRNLGTSSLDDYKLQLWFNQIVELTHTRESYFSTTNPITGWVMPLELSMEKGKVLYCPRFSLVPEDIDALPPFYVKAPVGTKDLILRWKLLSRNYHQSGELQIHIKDNIHSFPSNDSSAPIKGLKVVDCIILKENQ